MITQYGELSKEQYDEYLYRLGKRVFKILPMQEEQCTTLDVYRDSIAREVFGVSSVLLDAGIVEIVGMIKGFDLTNHETLRADVFSVCGLINRVRRNVD